MCLVCDSCDVLTGQGVSSITHHHTIASLAISSLNLANVLAGDTTRTEKKNELSARTLLMTGSVILTAFITFSSAICYSHKLQLTGVIVYMSYLSSLKELLTKSIIA